MPSFPASAFGDEVGYEVKHGVALIRLNAPARMNTFSKAMLHGMGTAIDMATEDSAVRVVVITGAGARAFSAGGDLSSATDGAATGFLANESDGIPATMQNGVRNLRAAMAPATAIREMAKPTIAAINGACAGAGLSLACACDLRFCSSNALFRTAFITAGVSGDFGGSWTLPRIVGSAKARELYLLNKKVSSAEALAMGLVSSVFPQAELLPRVMEIATALAAGPPLAIGRIKQNLNAADASGSFAEALDREAEHHARCAVHPDCAEAGAAFLGKRRPQFDGVGAQEPWRMSKL